MANPRTASRTASRRDDRAVASVVGFVLILAAAVTYYSYAAQNEVPRVGAQHERAWEEDVSAALARLVQGAGARAGSGAPVSEVLPAPPDAPAQTNPFLAPLRTARASGSIAYSDACGDATLVHTVGALVVTDLISGAGGCLTFRGDTAYADAFTYRVELGGLLRAQGDKAVVLIGPPLDVSVSHVSLTLIDLRGTSQSLGVDGADAFVGFTPRPGALEVGSTQNAQLIHWAFTTSYPEAWRDWYAGSFAGAGVSAQTSFTCADPSATGPARGPCTVVVDLAQITSLSISYGRYDVRLG